MWRLIVCVSLFILLLSACGSNTQSEFIVPENQIIGKFTPPAGQTLFIIGQDLGAVTGYKSHFNQEPGGVTTYTNISEGNQSILLFGLKEDANWGSGDINAQASINENPNSALSIGLFLVDETGQNLQNITNGTHDSAVKELGQFIKDANRPVFVRIGYEFDGPWNHYEPQPYIAAFQHIVDVWREMNVENFATVWQSATAPIPRYKNFPLEAWYPGDEYVDWVGSSYFEFRRYAHDELLAFAREHNKPVMIAESTPQGFDLEYLTYAPPSTDGSGAGEVTAVDIWEQWYQPYFDYIYENADVIRAVAYINVDWKNQPMWNPNAGNGYWGDSRLQINETISKLWEKELTSPIWLHGSDKLFSQLSANQ